MPSWCSVENVHSSENHHVQGEDSQEDFAALRPVLARPQRRAEQAFQHTVDRFNLPALCVTGQMQPGFHLSPPVAGGWLIRRAPNQGWD